MPENNQSTYRELGARVKRYRDSKGLLQRELAATLQIDAAVLSKIERGKRKPTTAQALKLSELAGIAAIRWDEAKHAEAARLSE